MAFNLTATTATTTTVGEFDSPTCENSALWQSPEKDWFQPYREKAHHNEDYSVMLAESPLTGKGVCLKVFLRFHVTSFAAYLSIRESDCPEAFKDPRLAPTEKWGTIAQTGWGQNGSGFNKKYIEAFRLIKETAEGDWSAWTCLTQDNRTTSYSPRNGWNTRFWSAELTDPGLAQAVFNFPLEIRGPSKKLPIPTPTSVDVGVVVTSKLHPDLGEMEIVAKDGDKFLVRREQHTPTHSGSCEQRMIVRAEQIGEPVRWSHRADLLVREYANALKRGSIKSWYSNHFFYSRNVVDPRSALD